MTNSSLRRVSHTLGCLLLLVSPLASIALAAIEQQAGSTSTTSKPLPAIINENVLIQPTSSDQQQPTTREPKPNTVGESRGIWPMVSVDKQDNKSNVDVHVPIFFDMTNSNDFAAGHSKLDLSVLHGLVTVSRDKSRDPDGLLNGPMQVTVFGIPVYTSGGRAPVVAKPPADRAQANQQQADWSRQTGDPAERPSKSEYNLEHVASSVNKTNERVLKSLSDLLGRLSSYVRPAALGGQAEQSGSSLGSGRDTSTNSTTSGSGSGGAAAKQSSLDKPVALALTMPKSTREPKVSRIFQDNGEDMAHGPLVYI